jgi:hypothetical protein
LFLANSPEVNMLKPLSPISVYASSTAIVIQIDGGGIAPMECIGILYPDASSPTQAKLTDDLIIRYGNKRLDEALPIFRLTTDYPADVLDLLGGKQPTAD